MEEKTDYSSKEFISSLIEQMKQDKKIVAEAFVETLMQHSSEMDQLKQELDQKNQLLQEKDAQIARIEETRKKNEPRRKREMEEEISELKTKVKDLEEQLKEEQENKKILENKVKLMTRELEQVRAKENTAKSKFGILIENLDPMIVVPLLYKNANCLVMETSSSKSGYLLKQGHMIKTWKIRFFILKDIFFLYYEDRKDLPPLGVLNVVCATVLDVDKSVFGKSFCFVVRTAFREIYCCASDEEEKEKWKKK